MTTFRSSEERAQYERMLSQAERLVSIIKAWPPNGAPGWKTAKGILEAWIWRYRR